MEPSHTLEKNLNDLTEITRRIHHARYPEAPLIYLAGSFVRGEATETSDLDLVVVFDSLPTAYRESFTFEDVPVEAFVHDPETLCYFFYEADRPKGVPSLAQMVDEGIQVPKPTTLSRNLKKMARHVLELGPPKLTKEALDEKRYQISNLIDDLRDPRSREELVGTATELYTELADFYLRSNGFWSATGKSVPRKLGVKDAAMPQRFAAAFDRIFIHSEATDVIALGEELLEPFAGLLWNDFHREAPADWRKDLKEILLR